MATEKKYMESNYRDHLLATWLWVVYLNSLRLSFLIYKWICFLFFSLSLSSLPLSLLFLCFSLSLWSLRASCSPYGCSVWSLHDGSANYSLGCLLSKQSSPGTQLHLFPMAAVTSQGVWVGVTIWPTTPKMFTVWPFETKLLTHGLRCHSSRDV